MAAKDNWDGFLMTAISYQELYSAEKVEKLYIVSTIACMVVYFKMGFVEEARKAANLLNASGGPQDIFAHLFAESIWKHLVAELSNGPHTIQ
eukprot:TRINITY_DN13701_c0_g1_i1.p2 TRINITY_DN13701_c0_g1~~TRINITY_DN13701_c0_g1_i1.p2  ORF type:complete len:108 (-),score=10.09 TRINITY_DN13701_c0_g1_i1:260-535(-)